MIWLCQQRFRWLVNPLLHPIVSYFFLTGSSARRSSKQFFIQAKGRYRYTDFYRQLLCFSQSLVDRVSILTGDSDRFEVHPQGREQLHATLDSGQGIILLGSHLGNYEASKLLASNRMGLDVHIVAYFAGSTKIRQALDAINPGMANNIIDPTQPDAVFKMREVIDAGGVLAILGDRTGIGDKNVQVEFLGKPTLMPAGPYFIAAVLHCPVFCFFGLRVDHFHYDTFAIKLADRIELKRGQRKEMAAKYAQLYADLLAEKAREYPYNWFNFYAFWNSPTETKL